MTKQIILIKNQFMANKICIIFGSSIKIRFLSMPVRQYDMFFFTEKKKSEPIRTQAAE